MKKTKITKEENFRITDIVVNMDTEIRSRKWITGPFNSNAQVYIDKSLVPTDNLREWFQDKVVVYFAFTRDGKIYTGYTTDFGQRLSTHCVGCKNDKANNVNKEFIKSAKKYGSIYVIPLECRSFSSFDGGKKDAVKWAKEYSKLMHKRMFMSERKTTNKKL
jgi:hypothetical protein